MKHFDHHPDKITYLHMCSVKFEIRPLRDLMDGNQEAETGESVNSRPHREFKDSQSCIKRPHPMWYPFSKVQLKPGPLS
jgi:hypothetical protein